MKAAHIPKIERRLRVAIETLLPESTSRDEAAAPGRRARPDRRGARGKPVRFTSDKEEE